MEVSTSNEFIQYQMDDKNIIVIFKFFLEKVKGGGRCPMLQGMESSCKCTLKL